MNTSGDVLEEDGFSGARWSDDQAALAKADRTEQIDAACGELGRIVLELDHWVRIDRGGIIESNALRPFIRRAPFNRGDTAEVLALGRALDEQAGAQSHFADCLARNKKTAALWPEGMCWVAQLAVAALVGELEDSFNFHLVRHNDSEQALDECKMTIYG
jgi:hypothetical protein